MRSPAIRSLVWRLGRKLYCWARREVSRGPEANGEHWLLEQVVTASSAKAPVLLDIGAHMGYWSDHAAALLRREKISGRVHAFEPASSTFAYLSGKFKASEFVSMNKIALSDQTGERDFFVAGEFAGTNSLVRTGGANVENVTAMRLDDFLAKEQIDSVLFVKSDAEGHDLNVMLGAAEALKAGRVDVWQFEYNHRWIGARAALRDVFDFIEDKPYLLGKLYEGDIEVFDLWHPELERFFEANYVLIRRGSEFERLCTRVRFNSRNVLIPNP